MNPLQRLTDIYTMVSYIMEHMDAETPKKENAQLDEIGKTTLAIADLLQTIETNTGADARKQYGACIKTLDEGANKILEELSTIKDFIDTDKTDTKKLYDKIEEVYISYTGILEQSTKSLEIQRQSYNSRLAGLTKELGALLRLTKSLDDKVASKDEMAEMLSQVEEQLSEVIEADKRQNEIYESNAKELKSMIEEIKDSYASLNQTLSATDENFKTAVSRLDVLLMQVKLLVEGRKRS